MSVWFPISVFIFTMFYEYAADRNWRISRNRNGGNTLRLQDCISPNYLKYLPHFADKHSIGIADLYSYSGDGRKKLAAVFTGRDVSTFDRWFARYLLYFISMREESNPLNTRLQLVRMRRWMTHSPLFQQSAESKH
ncbi:hypothetical protein SAMN05661044_00707 [Olivibacter domesticus]|uniref:Uncharacterized protein n=2 Tax=Olivibacter domesticus TaxID=407022 RepID=A0A1H7IJC4_OLID1|nr:hypothetical protein SAMN05661044_00707 [Olivibacter domesticus]